jgi:hypothetical protein
MDPTQYPVNGSSSYVLPLAFPLLVGYLRVYLIDVVQPSDLLTKTSGFVLNITGVVNSTNVTIASKIIILIELTEKLYIYIFSAQDVCPSVSSALSPRTILVAPPSQTGLTYANDIYVCDETTTR